MWKKVNQMKYIEKITIIPNFVIDLVYHLLSNMYNKL